MTDPQRTEEVTLLCVGGPHHGEEQTIPAGGTSWLDITTATSYYVKPMKYVERKGANLTPTALWEIKVLIHESLVPSAEDDQIATAHKTGAVMQMWTDVMMRKFMREHGVQKPLNEHPGHGQSNGHRRIQLPPDGGNLR